MITTEILEELLKRAEGPKLDFKSEQYRLDNEHFKSLFIKDILSIANSFGAEKGRIVIGIKTFPDGTKKVVGIRKHHDDADLQNIVKDKVDVMPEFAYKPIEFEGKSLAVITIPPSRDKPHRVIKKFAVLEKYAIYTRHGSSNAVATREEIDRMYLERFKGEDTERLPLFELKPKTGIPIILPPYKPVTPTPKVAMSEKINLPIPEDVANIVTKEDIDHYNKEVEDF